MIHGYERSTVVSADKFLRSEAGVWRFGWTLHRGKSWDSENHPSLRLIQKYVWDWSYVKHLYKHRLCPFIQFGCWWLRELPPGKGLLPGSFHSERTKIHPDLATRPWHYRLLVHKKLLSLFVWVYRQWIWLILYHIVMITTGKEKI